MAFAMAAIISWLKALYLPGRLKRTSATWFSIEIVTNSVMVPPLRMADCFFYMGSAVGRALNRPYPAGKDYF
jgi:hypothetical protein